MHRFNPSFKQKSLNSLPFCFSIFAFLSLSAMCSLPPLSALCLPTLSQTHAQSLGQFQNLTHTLTHSLSALCLHHLHHLVSSFNSQAHQPNSPLKYQNFHSQFLTLHYTLTCSITHCVLIF